MRNSTRSYWYEYLEPAEQEAELKKILEEEGKDESPSHPICQFPRKPRSRPIKTEWVTSEEKQPLENPLEERFKDEPSNGTSETESEDSYIINFEDEPSNGTSETESEDSYIINFEVRKAYIGPWTSEMDRVMATTLLSELKNGNKLTFGYNVEIIHRIVKDIQKQLKADVTHNEVQKRLRIHAENSKLIQKYTMKDGFAWCSKEKKIIADKETWEEELERNPASIFDQVTFPFHDEMTQVLPWY